MESYVQLAQIVALFSVAALCIYLIVSLVRLNVVMASLQRDIAEITKNLKPILENLAVVSEKVRSIATKVDDQVNLFKGSLEALRRAADNVEQFERRILLSLEEPIARIASSVGGLVQKLFTFFAGRSTKEQAG